MAATRPASADAPTADGSGERPERRHRLLWAAIFALLAFAAYRLVRSPAGPGFTTYSGEAMATTWQVTLPTGAGEAETARAAAAAEECFALFRRLDLELSEWKEGSPLSAVNRAAGVAPVAVPAELFELVARAVAIGRETDGAFDVSWAALWGLWDFRAEPPVVPERAAIAARRALVDYRRIVLDPAARTLFLPAAGMKLGLGGIAKGYALERAGALLGERGFADFLLVSGGQVYARGTRGGRAWQVGVRDPRGEREEIFATLPLAGGSLSTSADNESFFVVDGVRYHHILDPQTGWPSRGLRSATVLAADPTLADALSTAVMVLGRERGLAVARRLGAGALVIDEQGDVSMTPELAAIVTQLHPPRRS
jgi:thiamine biosynthesis lipoprotein